jgi:hypothetical protein
MSRTLKTILAAALGLSALTAPSASAQPPLPPGAIQPMEMEAEARAIERGGQALAELVEGMEPDERALMLSARADLKAVAAAMASAGEETGRLRSALAHYVVALDHAGSGKPERAVAHAMAALELIGPVSASYGATLSSRIERHKATFAAQGGLRRLVPEARAALANPRIDAVLKRLTEA